MKEDYLVKNLVEKIGNLLPFDTEDISLEFKESLKPLIESSFQKMKIITKEEFCSVYKFYLKFSSNQILPKNMKL